MKKYEKLEQQVKEIQKEIDRLKKEEKEVKLPNRFKRNYAISFLENPNHADLCNMFDWESSPEGINYWDALSDKILDNSQYEVPQEDIIQIQGWVIESYKQEYGVHSSILHNVPV